MKTNKNRVDELYKEAFRLLSRADELLKQVHEGCAKNQQELGQDIADIIADNINDLYDV